MRKRGIRSTKKRKESKEIVAKLYNLSIEKGRKGTKDIGREINK